MPVVVPVSSPAPGSLTDATSFDGRIRALDDPTYGGVRLRIDYTADPELWANPFTCTVYRENPDGTLHTVRGGDPYLNFARKGWLYDQEAPLGQPVAYFVVPIAADGSEGARSASASIVTSAPAGGFDKPDMWLINLENPSASVQARGMATLAGSYNGRSDKQTILGSPYPAVTPDARNGLATQISVLTVGEDEFNAMKKLLEQSIIMRKSSLWERPDGYFVIDDASYAAQTSGTGRGMYAWQMNLTEVARPNTYGQTVAMPGYSFADYKAQYPVFSAVPALPFDALQGGNMIDPYTSSADTDFSAAFGWSEYNGNTTLLRQNTLAFRGTYSWRLTATAAGEFGAYTLPLYAISAARTYTFTAWVYSTLGLLADVQLDWKDGGGGYLASDSLGEWGQKVQLTPNAWTKVQMSATPVPGSALATPIIKATATGAGQVVYYDVVTLESV